MANELAGGNIFPGCLDNRSYQIYRERGQLPIVFLNLIFMSTLIIGTLAQSLGILLGYWRMNRNG